MKNRNIIILTSLVILLLIIGGTIFKVSQLHLEKALVVSEKRIIEGAKNCDWDNVCKTFPITLGFLIDHGYAQEEVSPKTKLYYNHNSYIKKDNNEYLFIEKN